MYWPFKTKHQYIQTSYNNREYFRENQVTQRKEGTFHRYHIHLKLTCCCHVSSPGTTKLAAKTSDLSHDPLVHGGRAQSVVSGYLVHGHIHFRQTQLLLSPPVVIDLRETPGYLVSHKLTNLLSSVWGTTSLFLFCLLRSTHLKHQAICCYFSGLSRWPTPTLPKWNIFCKSCYCRLLVCSDLPVPQHPPPVAFQDNTHPPKSEIFFLKAVIVDCLYLGAFQDHRSYNNREYFTL